MLLENRIEELRKTASYDVEKLEPPKDLFPLNRSEDLKSWLESREKLREQKAKEHKPDA